MRINDKTYLADNLVFPVDQEQTGINENQIITGPTRSGKTVSVVEPRLLHATDQNLIVNVTKRAIVDKYAPILKARGYKVWDLNLVEPRKSNICYDPMLYLEDDKDVLNLAHIYVGGGESKDKQGNPDPYWNQSAESGLAAIIGLAKLNAEDQGRKFTFADFYNLYSSMIVKNERDIVATNLDILFEKAAKKYPRNQASRLWRTIEGLSYRTASCIFSVMNNAVDKLMTEEVVEMMSGGKKLSFEELGSKKVVLFITTSPVNKSMQKLATLFYTDAFRRLFEYAESLPSKELPRPIHFICDDFATGSVIPDFDQYISVFGAKRISVTLLLQSESQLENMYGKSAATTIINNVDTYAYLGGMDDLTCQNISKRSNLPLEDIYALPLEQVIVFRRGARPVRARRYQTYNDPLYRELLDKNNSR